VAVDVVLGIVEVGTKGGVLWIWVPSRAVCGAGRDGAGVNVAEVSKVSRSRMS